MLAKLSFDYSVNAFNGVREFQISILLFKLQISRKLLKVIRILFFYLELNVVNYFKKYCHVERLIFGLDLY